MSTSNAGVEIAQRCAATGHALVWHPGLRCKEPIRWLLRSLLTCILISYLAMRAGFGFRWSGTPTTGNTAECRGVPSLTSAVWSYHGRCWS